MLSHLFFWTLLKIISSDDCDCDLSGTIGHLSTCNQIDLDSSSCNCRPSVVQQTSCELCYPQFYNLSAINVFGCQRCSCDLGGSLSPVCDHVTGRCPCREGITGRDCDRPDTGTYIPALYHINSNLVIEHSISGLNLDDGRAEINGVIEPSDIADIPPRFELLFNQYPVPISLPDIESESANAVKKRKTKNNRRFARSVPDTLPIIRDVQHLSKREVQIMYATEIEFVRAGIYFLVLNYTATVETSVMVYVGHIEVPTVLPQCANCLIMLAGSLGVKGIDVSRAGKQNVKISTPSSVNIHYAVALPKEYYFTSSLKQDVSPRCNVGPFTELCNRYKYPVVSSFHHVEEAESWLSPASQPAYTLLVGVNMFGKENSIDSNGDGMKATNKIKMSLQLQPGIYYYVIVSYYKPYHYTQYTESFSAQVSFGASAPGEVEFISCSWEEGCRAAVTTQHKKLQLFYVTDTVELFTLKLEDESMVFIDSIMFIREEDWNLDLIQAQFYCVQGPDNECLPSEFIDLRDYVFYESESAIDAVKIELEDTFFHGTGVLLLDQSAPSLSVVLLENTITSTAPELYVVIVHYYKHTSNLARGTVYIQDDNNSQGDVLYKFCPSASGCRVAATIPGRIESGVVSHNPSWTGYWTPLSVTGGNTVIILTLSLTHPEFVYVDYLSLVPLRDFTVDMLYPLPLDHGPLFTQYCAYHYLYLTPEPLLESYCKKIAFSMTTRFNNGTLECDCDGAGSLSDTCDQATGQCRCKYGFGGRACDQCTGGGNFGYPNCTECGCDPENSLSESCDQETGQCECEENYSGLQCTECAAGYHGYSEDKLVCDMPCDCDLQGSTGMSCNLSTAQCSCRESTTGRACDTCRPAHYRFPACYPCECSPTTSLSNECDITGTCRCKVGYSGTRCEECADTHYFNSTQCVPCGCSGLDTVCSGVRYYPYQEVEDFTLGYSGYTLVDSSGNLSPSSATKLTTISYNGDPHVLMVNLSSADEFTYLRLPARFEGDKRSADFQMFSYDLDLISSGNVDIVAETVFQGRTMSLVHREEVSHISNEPLKAEVEIPLLTSPQWRIRDTEVQPSNPQIQSVLRDLVEIRIGTKVFDRQTVAMIDNIELGYLSTIPNSEDPLYYPICECGVGYTGERCENCALGYSRSPDTGLCDTPCQCSGNSEQCTEQGVCLDCTNNSRGDACEDCVPGYYHSTATQQCEPCGCSGNGITTSTLECEEVDGEKVCVSCEVGYTGISCTICDNGYHGNASSETGCVECPCNVNLNLTVPDACHPVSGSCDVCIDSVNGEQCEDCATGYYGDAVSSTCTPCDCFPLGSVSHKCDEQGRCRCKGDIAGDKCDQCELGWYVSNSRCRRCECFVLSSTSTLCDTRTGQCDCVSGFGGRTCRVCDTGHYERANNCLDCGCSESGSTDTTCNENGVCTCKPGYYGDQCMECADTHLTNNDGSCTVCGECPMMLLDRIADVNDTIELSKTDAMLADYADELNRIKERAKVIDNSLAAPDDMSELLDLLNSTKADSADNTQTADSLTPRGQEAFADAGDLTRDVGDVPDNVTMLEEEIGDLIGKLDNFNLHPDVLESGDAGQEAQDLIDEMTGRDPAEELQASKEGKKEAEDLDEAAKAATPANITFPTLDPLPERVEFVQDTVEDADKDLANETQAVDLIGFTVNAVEIAEGVAGYLEDELKDKISNTTSHIAPITDNTAAAKEGLDGIEIPDLQPLRALVGDQKEALSELTPLVKPKEFNCSGLDGFKNVSSDDPGPTFIREMIKAEKDLDELRIKIAEAEEGARNTTDKVNELDREVANKGLEMSNFELTTADLVPKLNDLVSEEPAKRGVIEELGTDNEADRARLDALQLPQIPQHSIPEAPENVVETPNPDPLQDRLDNIEPVPDLFDVNDKLPGLIIDTDQAEARKNVVVEESRKIDYRLRSLQDKIEKAKRSVETILIPMRFTGDDSYAKYSTKLDKSGYLSVRASVKPEEDRASGGIVYIGPDRDENRLKRQATGADYVEVGLLNGYVVCNINIDNNEETLFQSDLLVLKDTWTYVHLQRIGGYISLSVNSTEMKSDTDDPGTTSSFNAKNIVIGKSTQGSLKGSITDLYINGERISQWLTDLSVGVNKSVWADRMISDDKDIYYFDGDTAYLAFQTIRGPNPYLRTVSVNVKTSSEDGLIMFYGEGSEVEGNQEVFAMDLYQGDLRLHYTNADRGLDTVTISPEDDLYFADRTFKDLSAFIQIRGPGKSVASIRSPYGRDAAAIPGTLQFGQYPTPSLTFFGRVPSTITQRFPSMFGEGGISDVPFTGCMSPVRINNAVVRQNNVETARNVKNGCPDKMVSSLSLRNEGMAKLKNSLLGDLSFGITTVATSGNILYIGNNQSDYLLVSVFEGKLAVKLVLGGASPQVIKSHAVVNTGNRRYIRIVLSLEDRISLYVDDVLEGSESLEVSLFEVDPSFSVYLGQLPPEMGLRGAGYTGCISQLVVRDKIYNFAKDIDDKQNVILDRCRAIKSYALEVDPTATAPSLEVANLMAGRSCVSLQSNSAPDSFLVSSANNKMNYLKIDNIRSDKIVVRLRVELTVSTLSRRGVLLYTRSKQDKYILLKFSEDRVTLMVNLWREPFLVEQTVTINDGTPHRIEIERNAFNFQLIVDGKASDGSMAQESRGPMFVLDSNDDLHSCSNGICIGGAPHSALQDQSLGFDPQFVGCLTDIVMSRVSYTAATITTVGSVPRCTESNTLSHSHYFSGQAAIIPDVAVSESDSIEISFRSSRQTGVLLSLLDSANNTILQISLDNDKAVVTLNDRSVELGPVEGATPLYFCDVTTPHTLKVVLQGTSATISVDGEADVTVDVTSDVTTFRLGDQFMGCVENPLINGVTVSLANPRLNSGVLLNSCPNQAF